jgi:hypothetical protein
MKLGIDANRVANIVKNRDLDALGKLINQSAGPTAPTSVKGNSPPATAPSTRTASKGTAPLDGSSMQARGARSVADGRTIKQMREEKASAAGFDSLDEPNLKRAMKAFRRKLKSYRRDDESKLGSKYVTSGKSSGISAITPPAEYPPPVWAKLVELGRLKKAGGGTYELP